MSEPSRPGQSQFILTLMQLNAAQKAAKVGTPEREAADHELAHFLRMHANGRVQEWYASRKGEA